MSKHDHTLEFLLDLDGEIIVLSEGYWVKFEAKRVRESGNRPQGIKYSLTLHNDKGERVIGFDNAHKIPGKGEYTTYDHKHHVRRGSRIKEYHYGTAGKLMEDFWQEVNDFLGELL